jgi:pilus assembly protein Flp/PilA
MERIKNFFKDESGASAVEYGLLVSLIAVIIIGAVTLLGGNLNTKLTAAANGIGG